MRLPPRLTVGTVTAFFSPFQTKKNIPVPKQVKFSLNRPKIRFPKLVTMVRMFMGKPQLFQQWKRSPRWRALTTVFLDTSIPYEASSVTVTFAETRRSTLTPDCYSLCFQPRLPEAHFFIFWHNELPKVSEQSKCHWPCSPEFLMERSLLIYSDVVWKISEWSGLSWKRINTQELIILDLSFYGCYTSTCMIMKYLSTRTQV